MDMTSLTSHFLSLCSFATSDVVFCCVVVSLPPLSWASSRAALAWYIDFFLVSQSPGEMESIWLFTCWVKSLPSTHAILFYSSYREHAVIVFPCTPTWKWRGSHCVGFRIPYALPLLPAGGQRYIPTILRKEGTDDSTFWSWPSPEAKTCRKANLYLLFKKQPKSCITFFHMSKETWLHLE